MHCIRNFNVFPKSPPDGLLTLHDAKYDVDLDPDPFLLDICIDDLPPARLYHLTTTDKIIMNTSEDEPSPGLNGRLRPRKSSYVQSPQSKTKIRTDGKSSQERPKRTSTPSKPSPNKQDDLATKSDFSTALQFLCPYCDKKFASKQTMSKHVRRNHFQNEKGLLLDCLFCNHSEADTCIIRHMVDSHPNQYFACLDCNTRFSSTSELAEHKLHICEKQKLTFRTKLRQKPRGAKKSKKTLGIVRKDENKDFQDSHGFNGVVISCELKPPQDHDGADIEDNITTNLILPSTKNLGNNAILEKNAVIILDDIQWNKRIPSNFSFHNTDPDQILSRLGVVHRSPRTAESAKKEWFKLMDDSNQKFERCFDTKFYSKVASNVQENLSKYLDGSCNFNPDPENMIKTRRSKNNVVINTAEGFPILLACEQYSRSAFDSYLPRAIAPKHKWKWENDKNPFNADQIKRDSHTNNCIITLVSGLDIWTQLSMRKKFEAIYNRQPVEKKTEKQNIITKELKEILESREIPTSSQVVRYTSNPMPSTSKSDFPASLGLVPSTPTQEMQPAVLSGEWVRPRCYVCCACGEQTTDPKDLSTHILARHPNAHVQHYEIVGEQLLDADILKHLYVPPRTNRTRLPRGFKECTKCNKSVTLEELHQHMLDCAGDTPAVRRRQCRHRPFNVRRRRPRIPDNTIRKNMRKDMRSRKRRQKAHIRPRPRIRTEVGDAETIRRMIADLPAKRHRVLVNPVHHTQRPRRKLDMQRNKFMLTKRSVDDLSNRKRRLNNESSSDSNSIKQASSLDDDEDNKPLKPREPSKAFKPKEEIRTLKPKLRTMVSKSKHQRDALKRTVMTSTKRKSVRVQKKTPAESTDIFDKTSVASTSKDMQEASVDKSPERLDVRKGSYNTREHANRGGSGNRDGQRPGSSGSSCSGGNNTQAPAQNIPLKHSIARLTANSETHDKSVQFHHSFLVQQECNNTNQHVPTGQPTLFENEAVVTKLDKPPLNYTHKNKLNKPRKGLNDCIAMLKNKLVDPEPSEPPGHVSVQCGSDEPIDAGPVIDTNLKEGITTPGNDNPECYKNNTEDGCRKKDPPETVQKDELPDNVTIISKISLPENIISVEKANSNQNDKIIMSVNNSELDENHKEKSPKVIEQKSAIEGPLTSSKVRTGSDIAVTRVISEPTGPKRKAIHRQPKSNTDNIITDLNKAASKPAETNTRLRLTRATHKQMEANLRSRIIKPTSKCDDTNIKKNFREHSSTPISINTPKLIEINTAPVVAPRALGSTASPRPLETCNLGANISPHSIDKTSKLVATKSPRPHEINLNVLTYHALNNEISISPRPRMAITSPHIDMNTNVQLEKPRKSENEKTSPRTRSSFELNHLTVDAKGDLYKLKSTESKLSLKTISDGHHRKVDISKNVEPSGSLVNFDGFSESRPIVTNMLPAHSNILLEPLIVAGPLDLSSKVNRSKEASINLNPCASHYGNYETLDLSNSTSRSKLSDSYIPEDVVVDLRVKPSGALRKEESWNLCLKSSNQMYKTSDVTGMDNTNRPTDLSLKGQETVEQRGQHLIESDHVSAHKTVQLEKTISNYEECSVLNPPADKTGKVIKFIKQRFCEDAKQDNTNQQDISTLKDRICTEEAANKPVIHPENTKLSYNIEESSKVEYRRALEKQTLKSPKSRFSEKYAPHMPKPIYDPTLRIPQFKLRPDGEEVTEVVPPTSKIPGDQHFSNVSIGYQKSSQVFENVSQGALTGGVALQTLPNPECSTPTYSFTNMGTPVTKIEASEPTAINNTLSSTVPSSVIVNSSHVYTHTRASGTPNKFGDLNIDFPTINSTDVYTHSRTLTDSSSKFGTLNTDFTASQNKVGMSITSPTDEKGSDSNKTKEKSKHNVNYEQDPDTVRKIAMLPKELVEIIGTMPIDHRKQLLNVLPQYVSPPLSVTAPITNVPKEIDSAEPAPKIVASNVVNEDTNNDKDSSKKVTSLSPSLQQVSTKESSDHTKGINKLIDPSVLQSDHNTLETCQSIDKTPASNDNILLLNSGKGKPLEVDSNNKLTDPPVIAADKGFVPDFIKEPEKVIDLTEDEVPSIPTTLNLPLSSNPPLKESANIIPLTTKAIKQKSNEKTASLRAVRIKAPSERQRESQILKRASVEQVVPQVIPEPDDIDLSKSLAIQQAEISSTQQKLANLSKIKATLAVPNVGELKAKPCSPSVTNLVEKNTDTLDTIPSAAIENVILPAPISKPEGENIPQDETSSNMNLNTYIEATKEEKPFQQNQTIQLELKNENLKDDMEQTQGEISVPAVDKTDENTLTPNIETNTSEQDDSEDDMILAAIVKQKKSELNQQIEIDINPKQSVSLEKKRKKGKKSKKTVYSKIKDSDDTTLTYEKPGTISEPFDTTEKEIHQDVISSKRRTKRKKENQKGKNKQKCQKNKEIHNSDKLLKSDTIIMPNDQVKPDHSDIGNNKPTTDQDVFLNDSVKNDIQTSSNTQTSILESHIDDGPLIPKVPNNDGEVELFKEEKQCEVLKENVEIVPSISKTKTMTEMHLNDCTLNHSPPASDEVIKDSENKSETEEITESSEKNIKDAENKSEKEEVKESSVKIIKDFENTPEKDAIKESNVDVINNTSAQESPLKGNFVDSYVKNLPLRRSRRGKPLSEVPAETSENESIANITTDLKAPLTKKQLIFSKLLLDEENQNKSRISNEAKVVDKPDLTIPPSKTTTGKSKSIKRKQSPQLKRKCKIKKSLESAEMEENNLETDEKGTDIHPPQPPLLPPSPPPPPPLPNDIDILDTEKSPTIEENLKQSKDVSPEGLKDVENECKLDVGDKGKDLDLTKHSTEKRKLANLQSSPMESDSKPKKPKFTKNKDNDSIKTSDDTTHKTTNNKTDDIATTTISKPANTKIYQMTCYDIPIAARRTRSKSVAAKSLSTEVYDPYDIDLDEMIKKDEPIKEKSSKHTKGKIKIKTMKKLGKTEKIEKCIPLGTEATLKQQNNNKSKIIVKPTKDEKSEKDTSICNPKIVKNKNIKENLTKDNSSDSDDSSKSINISLRKYVENKAKKVLEKSESTTETTTAGKNSNARVNKTSSSSVTVDKKDKLDENEEQMRSEQFMESFGFFSERKPRKSNLLASKKISETFHIIASESDDSYIESGQKHSRKSSHSENKRNNDGDKKTLKRGRKKKNSFLEKVTYCELCMKDFRRPDNYARHTINILHVTRVASVELKMNIMPIRESPNVYYALKLQLDHIRKIREKSRSEGKLIKSLDLPNMTQMVKETFRTVRAQRLLRLAPRDLSSDEALFIDCCELLKESHKPTSDPKTQLLTDSGTQFVVDSQTGLVPHPNTLLSENVQIPLVVDLKTQLEENSKNQALVELETLPTVESEIPPSVDSKQQILNIPPSPLNWPTYDTDDTSDYKSDVESEQTIKIFECEECNLEKELLTAELIKSPECTEYPCLTRIARPRFVLPNIILQEDIIENEPKKISMDVRFKSVVENDTHKNIKPLEFKEKMYPDIEEIDMFEDKFDKIKRKCRSQAAAAKQVPPVTEPLSGSKGRKKLDKKKGKKISKKNHQNTVLTKGALKGFDGVKVSIPTSDINMSAIATSQDSEQKKKRKITSKKKRDRKEFEKTDTCESDHRNKDNVLSQKVDVYEFMDNEDAELFEFRPSTLMERFKSISNKESVNTTKKDSKVTQQENTSESASDGDDFVYMSDDYVCSDEETENSLMSCELANSKSDLKKTASLKRKDIVEKNAVMGKIFKHNAVRSEKKVKNKDSAKSKSSLDKLFDSLLVEESNSTSGNVGSQSPKKEASTLIANSTLSTKYEILKSCEKQNELESTPPPNRSNQYSPGPLTSKSDDYYGPSTSKKFDTFLPRNDSLSPKKLDLSPKNDLPSEIAQDLQNSEYSAGIYDDTGVARQRARRKCTVGKQNVLAETWSSESEPDGVPPRPNSAESVIASGSRKKKGRKRDGTNLSKRGKTSFNKKLDSESRVNNSNRETSSGGGGGLEAEVERAPPSPVAGPSGLCSHAPAPKMRPRPATYYWSSEGDDDTEQEHQRQHGWIVGDSHKKLVTMLAHAKGRKRNNDDKRHFVE